MKNWIVENWQGIVGGGSLTTILSYVVNRKNTKADFLTKVENIYSGLVDELKADRETLKEDIKQLRTDYRSIQSQFNDIQLAYAKEVEQSQNWEKLHRELTQKYNDLAKNHENLKSFCEKLKDELDKYKKLK